MEMHAQISPHTTHTYASPPRTNAFTLTRAHMYASTHSHMHASTRTHMYASTHTHTTLTCTHIIMYASTHAHHIIHIHTHMYASIHTHNPHTQHINFPNRGDSQVVQKGGVSACAWLDRKVVMAMFSNSQPSSTASVLRRQKDHTRTPVRCPESILLYNKYMGGVDRGDQLRGYYTCRTKSRKFYKYISFFLFDVAVTNAYVLQKNFCPENVHKNLKEFRLQLARELIGDYCNRRRAGRRPSQIITLPLRHFPIRIPGESQNTKFKRGRCAHCKVSHCRRDSTWFCRECKVWLCHSGDPREDCFLKWHTGREL